MDEMHLQLSNQRHNLLLASTFCMLFAGCMPASAPDKPTVMSGSTARPVVVVLLGDRTRQQLLRQLAVASSAIVKHEAGESRVAATIANREVRITTSPDDRVKAYASQSSMASLAVIVVDATTGPMPIHREHILFARQMDIPNIMVVFTNSDAIDDPELLELEELELRELLNWRDWNGDTATVGYDSERARVEHARGIVKGAPAICQFLCKSPDRPKPLDGEVCKSCTVHLYALPKIVAFPLKTSGIPSGHSTAVFGKEVTRARINVKKTISPGAKGDAVLDFDVPIRIHLNQRCVILISDHIAAAGVVRDTKP